MKKKVEILIFLYYNINKMFFLLSLLMAIENKGGNMIREPVVAGAFYPANPESLDHMIKEYLQNAHISIKGHIFGIISPHAGYPYSGPTAAYGYKAIMGKKYSTVVLIGPSHYSIFNGMSIYPKGEWRTPLGTVKIDEDFAKRLMAQNEKIDYFPEGHSQEHSIEVEIPFLQEVLKNFKIVPIVMGNQTEDNINILVQSLIKTIKDPEHTLLLASSDLYHGYSYEQAKEIDQNVINYISDYDGHGLFSFVRSMEERRIGAACGGGPIAVVLKTTKKLGGKSVRILHTTTSADVTGSYGGYVVGYVSAVIIGENENNKKVNNQESNVFKLNKKEKETLLNIARKTLEQYLSSHTTPEFNVSDKTLKTKTGVFVTLKEGGNLRGCIGLIRGLKPLYEGVIEMAIAAATQDPRFPPVSYSELKDIEIEISVLTPFQKVNSPDEIKVGRDGLYIESGFYSGLLLPQVPTEYNWDKRTFLEETCHKAGLSGDCWKRPETKIYKFQALVFSENNE